MSEEEIDIILALLNEKKYKIRKEDAEQILDWLDP